jgi:putative phosphoesterase
VILKSERSPAMRAGPSFDDLRQHQDRPSMRIAALYDIHGNLPALEAVLREIDGMNVDQVVVGGDVVPGPMPRECLGLLRELAIPLHFIRGNCEVAVLAEVAGADMPGLPEQTKAAMRWTAAQIAPEDVGLIASWPKTFRLAIPGLGNVLFCHGTPRNENEVFTRLTPAERLVPIFEGLDAAVIVCGHTHMPFDRRIGSTRVVNAGSVGMPFGETGACWLLLSPDIELRRTSYDLMSAAERIRATDDPQAAHFAANHVLRPPSEEQMLEVFARVEIR